MKIRLTRLIVLIMALCTSGGFLMLYHYLTTDLENQTFQATEEALIDTAYILTGIVESNIQDDQIQIDTLKSALTISHNKAFEAKVYQLIKTNVGIHVYVTNSEGIAIYDSKGIFTDQDMSQYNDVLRAHKGTYGARSSRLIENNPNSSVMYVAAPVKYDNKVIGSLTVYKAQEDVRLFITSRRKWIGLSVSMIAIGIIVFTIAVFTWIFRPIGKLTNYANAMTRGERPSVPKLGRGREVNTLGNALTAMRKSLDGKSYIENYTQILTHELKSPLAAIRGSAELLQEDMPIEQRKKFLVNIQNETNRSQRIIDGLLKLSHLEAQTQLIKKEPVNFLELSQDLHDSLQHRLEAKQINLEIHSPSDIELLCDRNLFLTALTNLLENAIHHSSPRDLIEITAEYSLESNQTIIIIKDAGTGIPDYALPRVFERFYSISKPNSSQKSSGLGLPFAKEVIELHQGTIQLENILAPESGTIVTITLP